MISVNELLSSMKELLPIYTDSYDKQLRIIINGAISKLENEGVPNTFETGTPKGCDYAMCISYQVAMDMDFDVDIKRMREQYLNRVNTLRLCVKKQA